MNIRFEETQFYQVDIVGESFDNRQQIILESARPGMLVRLRPEPDNPKDKKAISVDIETTPGHFHSVGYIPRAETADFHNYLKEGYELLGYISNISGGSPQRPTVGLRIEIHARKLGDPEPFQMPRPTPTNDHIAEKKADIQKKPSGFWKHWKLLAGTLAILVISVLGIYFYNYYYGPCGLKHVEKADVALKESIRRYNDFEKVASNTPRIALAGQVTILQEIRNDLLDMEVPRCMEKAKYSLGNIYAYSISGYTAFMGEESDAKINSYFKMASDNMDAYFIEMQRIEDCAPNCKD